MIECLQKTVASMMNRVRVNRVERTIRNRVPVFVKRRRIGGSIVIWLGNRFLSMAGSRICMFVRTREWIAWEVHCAGLLYPDRPAVTAGPGNAVYLTEVCGISLRELLRRGEPDLKAFVAAACELRRVHQIHCDEYNDAWSHGDLHLDNILYDAVSVQATLIDFDTRHELEFNTTWRHADDLKIVLLELIATSDENWRQPATAFLQEYGEAAVLNELSRQLFVPRGFARILWYTRTRCNSIPQIAQRLQSLREIIHQLDESTRTPL